MIALCLNCDGIVRGYGTGNSQQMDRKYTCALASRQVSVLALCFVMKLDGNCEGGDGW